ncbi:LysR substrate-binding domain-containing protein [Roseovarius rhodophyticola]|uniref:LysR substrate-binding domain-containing protein n=1 Tax=Roseovarius rhodophyticola TaxID=3080827 RepID=A0ABZ2TCI2_9RHOB|nr:LysR substrate-binding domain-containing protein [Roseovarius sp. W115]MDV2931080.1 LysR substrate-binding domain-containing protein [Roseovarius sp. W115]
MRKPPTPPLDLLEPFEASARLGSFTRAAKELSVTQSAISQRVRKLEDLLNTKLFERGHRTITLTPEGRELLNGVSVALQHLTSATHSLRQRESRPIVRLSADTSIAQLWLMPRLESFLLGAHGLAVDLTVSDTEDEVLNADVAILHGAGDWPGFTAELLFPDEIYPVCSRSYLARYPMRDPSDLLEAELIDLDYIRWNWINWGIWLTEAGFDPARARVLLRTNSYMALLDAARAGLGVALGWGPLMDQDLADGLLIRPLHISVRPDYGYYLLVRDNSGDSPHKLARHLKSATLIR